MIPRSLVYGAQDSFGSECSLIFEITTTSCPRCQAGMQAFLPAAEGSFRVGSTSAMSLVCGHCQSTVTSQQVHVVAPSAPEVGIATVKAVASDIFTEDEFVGIPWRSFVPHELRRDANGKPIVIARGASLHSSARIRGPVVIDAKSSVGARSVIGPYTGVVNSKIADEVTFEECRVIDTAVFGQNHIRKHLLRSAIIPESRFRA